MALNIYVTLQSGVSNMLTVIILGYDSLQLDFLEKQVQGRRLNFFKLDHEI